MEHMPSYLDNLRTDIQPSYKDSLMHHGIKGMKWGIRRYQNSDGSLTPAGKKRYSLNPIKRFNEKWQENKSRFAAQKQFDDLNNRTNKMFNDAKFADAKYGDPSKAWDAEYASFEYDDTRSPKKYNEALKLSYDYGYDYGKKAGKSLVKKYGNDAVNWYIDRQTNHSNGEYTINDIGKALESAKQPNAAERFAKYCANKERDYAEEWMDSR